MRKMEVILDGQVFQVELDSGPACSSMLRVYVNGAPVQVLVPNLDGKFEEVMWLAVDGRPCELILDRDLHWIQDGNGVYEVKFREMGSRAPGPNGKHGPVRAPIPGQITELLITAGETVEAGQALLVLEAMKMQNEIRAHASGFVQAVHVTAGENVKRGDLLVEISSTGQG